VRLVPPPVDTSEQAAPDPKAHLCHFHINRQAVIGLLDHLYRLTRSIMKYLLP